MLSPQRYRPVPGSAPDGDAGTGDRGTVGVDVWTIDLDQVYGRGRHSGSGRCSRKASGNGHTGPTSIRRAASPPNGQTPPRSEPHAA